MNRLPDFSDIIKAQMRLKGIVKQTPLEHTKSFSAMSGAHVYMKLENMQSTGSFKVRGAYNELSSLSGVASLAAVLHKKIDLAGRNVVPVISGGNINMGLLEQILEKGLMEEGLRARIAVLIPDVAGELKSIISILERLRANINEISHERSITTVPVGYVLVTITFSLQETAQLDAIRQTLDSKLKKYEVLR